MQTNFGFAYTIVWLHISYALFDMSKLNPSADYFLSDISVKWETIDMRKMKFNRIFRLYLWWRCGIRWNEWIRINSRTVRPVDFNTVNEKSEFKKSSTNYQQMNATTKMVPYTERKILRKNEYLFSSLSTTIKRKTHLMSWRVSAVRHFRELKMN